MDLDSVATELYALHPRDFIAARDARAKEAKAAGDAEVAREVSRLRKPTVVAWLANQLAQQRADEIAQLLELGHALRKATATLSGPKLRELSGQRQQVVRAMVQQARALARDADQQVSESVARELEDTLNAALADPAAAEELSRGRLTEGLEHTGFGTPGEPPARSPDRAAERPAKTATAGKPTAAKPSAADRRRAERRQKLDRELGEAWAAARKAADARAEADAAAESADKEAQAAQRDVDRLRGELREAEEHLTAARDRRKKATTARETARREAERATRRVSELQAQLENV